MVLSSSGVSRLGVDKWVLVDLERGCFRAISIALSNAKLILSLSGKSMLSLQRNAITTTMKMLDALIIRHLPVLLSQRSGVVLVQPSVYKMRSLILIHTCHQKALNLYLL
jgi:hypothetical protein